MHDLTTIAPSANIVTSDTRFGAIRSVTIGTKVWFVAGDVCKALGIKNSRQALTSVCSNDTGKMRLNNKGGSPHTMVSESGLYDLVLQSRKRTALAFRRFLTSEVIPSLFKHGVYVAGQEWMTDAELQGAVNSRGERLIEGTRAQRHARIAADVSSFAARKGRRPNSRELFWLQKP